MPAETGIGPVFKRSFGALAVLPGILLAHVERDHFAGDEPPLWAGVSLVATRGIWSTTKPFCSEICSTALVKGSMFAITN